MSQTPPMKVDAPLPGSGRDRTPEINSKREKRTRDDQDDDRSRSDRRRHDRERERDDGDDHDRERRHRRHRDGDRERREETDEEREERRRKRRERDDRHRDRSRESHRSHPRERSERGGSGIRDMSREEKEREREKRDREMQEERRANHDRERDGDRRRPRDDRGDRFDRPSHRDDRPPPRDDRPPPPGRDQRNSLPPRPPGSPPRRRPSPSYDGPRGGRGGGPRESPPPPPPPKDPVQQLIDEIDRENRSVFVSQISSRLMSQDLGDFFVDMLGPGSVRDARVVMDKGRRSKGIAYVELDTVELLNKALSLSGTIVMGIPIMIKQTESERNREGQMEAAKAKITSGEWERELKYKEEKERQSRPQKTFTPKFPPLSTGLSIPANLDVDKNKHAAIPYHRLFLTGVAYSLTPDDIGQVFEAFGPIEFVDLHRDHHGQSKGTAYVQFQNLQAAQVALDSMDNFELAGRPIRVSAVEDRTEGRQMVEDTSYAPRMDHNARRDLMQKLARTETPQAAPARSQPSQQAIAQPTPFLLVGNMFNPDDETERNWDLDMAEDIKGEVESKYGPIRKIKVDKMSRGDVYMVFDATASATKAHQGLGGRFFGGRQLTTNYITEAIFKAHM